MGTITFPRSPAGMGRSISVRGFARGGRAPPGGDGRRPLLPTGPGTRGRPIAVLPSAVRPRRECHLQTTTAAVTRRRSSTGTGAPCSSTPTRERVMAAPCCCASGAVPTPTPQPPPGSAPSPRCGRLWAAPAPGAMLGAPVLTVLPFRAAVFPGAATAWRRDRLDQVWAVRGDRALIGWVASSSGASTTPSPRRIVARRFVARRPAACAASPCASWPRQAAACRAGSFGVRRVAPRRAPAGTGASVWRTARCGRRSRSAATGSGPRAAGSSACRPPQAGLRRWRMASLGGACVASLRSALHWGDTGGPGTRPQKEGLAMRRRRVAVRVLAVCLVWRGARRRARRLRAALHRARQGTRCWGSPDVGTTLEAILQANPGSAVQAPSWPGSAPARRRGVDLYRPGGHPLVSPAGSTRVETWRPARMVNPTAS